MKHGYVQNGISVWSRSVGARLLDEWAAMMDVVDRDAPFAFAMCSNFASFCRVEGASLPVRRLQSWSGTDFIFGVSTQRHRHVYWIKSSDILHSALPTARLGSVLY